MATQAERRSATRACILNAAARLFEKNGYDASSVDQITASARVAKGTFYQHFETKLDVLLAITRRQQEELMRSIVAALESGYPPLEVGLSLVQGIAQWCREHGRAAGEMVLRALQGMDQEHDSTARVTFARIFQAAQKRGEIRRDVSADVLATAVLGAMIPWMVYWSKFPSAGDLAAYMEQTWQVILEGARRRRRT
jgi:AcrR family transcriptional regulator